MKVFAGILVVIGIGLSVWLAVEYIIDELFNINDLKDDDYGC